MSGKMKLAHRHVLSAAVGALAVLLLSILIACVLSLVCNVPASVGTPFVFFLSETVKAISVFVGVPAVVLGVWTYIRGVEQHQRAILDQQLAQTWKRKEFVANNMKEFFNTREVQLAMQMLDYS